MVKTNLQLVYSITLPASFARRPYYFSGFKQTYMLGVTCSINCMSHNTSNQPEIDQIKQTKPPES